MEDSGIDPNLEIFDEDEDELADSAEEDEDETHPAPTPPVQDDDEDEEDIDDAAEEDEEDIEDTKTDTVVIEIPDAQGGKIVVEEDKAKFEELVDQAKQQIQEQEVMRERQAQEDQKKLEQIIQETPVFQEIIAQAPPSQTPSQPPATIANLAIAAGENPAQIRQELIRTEARITAQTQVLVARGVLQPKEVKKTVKKKFLRAKAKKTKQLVRKVAKKKGIQIAKSTDGLQIDGASYEADGIYGVDPKKKQRSKDSAWTAFEERFHKVALADPNKPGDIKRMTTNLHSGLKLPTTGAAVHSAGPPKQVAALYAIDRNGKETLLDKKPYADNGKVVLLTNAFEKKQKEGTYLYQVRKEAYISLFPEGWTWLASTLPLPQDQSEPVIVEVLPAEVIDIEEPIIQSIEGVDIAGLSDIKISKTGDGRVRVTGISDISSVVIGTFSSAVFTSAMLADIDNGLFEVVSPRPLEPGDHEVVIYASRPEENAQSSPVKLKFNIVDTARAAAEEDTNLPVPSPAAEENKFPIVPVTAGGIILILIGVAVLKKRNKNPS